MVDLIPDAGLWAGAVLWTSALDWGEANGNNTGKNETVDAYDKTAHT